MKMFSATAAVLGLLIATACTDRGTQNTQDFAEEQVPPTTSAPAPDYATGADTTGAMDRDLSTRRDSSAAPRATARKNNTARRSSAPVATESRRADSDRVGETAPPSIRDLDHRRPDASAAPPAPRVTWRELTIPAGTALPLELETTLSSETAQVETPVRARLRSDVEINGHTALPAGAILTGTVTDVDRAGRVKGRARLAFAFTEVRLENGREDLRTNPVSFEGEQSKGEDATKIGAGAGIGAIIGGIAGGGKGAAKGAAIGGAAGTGAVLATRGKDVELASGTDITATVASPATVRVQAR